MTITTRLMTVEDLERIRLPEGLWEVIDGELVDVTGAGGKHTNVTGNVYHHLSVHVRPSRLGLILLPDSSIVVTENPLMVRLPDTGFIRADRLPLDQIPDGYIRVVPDLVVEVRSPGDSRREVVAKGMMWREAGAGLVWLVDPITEMVTELARGREPRELTAEHSLDGGEVLPGFQLPVRD
ncbi:MAG: Uma2 family endonuclease, partial [Chloroflexota bacterium]|nr:Uma2 family endonuclease [Chloroflexota bacterium]